MRKRLWSLAAIILAAGFAVPGVGSEVCISSSPALWRLVDGPEFPGAKGVLESGGGVLSLSGDFTGGGRYVGASIRGDLPLFKELVFDVKAPGQRIAIRFLDSEGQTHQYNRPLTGNAEKWQTVACPVADSAAHWGGANDGKFRGPIKALTILLHASDMPEKRGTLRIRDLKLRGAETAGMKFFAFPVDLTKLFITPGSTEPIRFRMSVGRTGFNPEELAFVYRDYAGKTVTKGQAEYTGEILSVPPPQQVGYYDLVFPTLGINSAVVVDQPVTGPADGFFAIDVALSRGGFDADRFGELFRILHNNNISWIRDRLTYGVLQPAEDRFNFEANSGRYRELREAAARAGLKQLDVFHDTPTWNKQLVSDKDDYIIGGDVRGNYTRGSNLYPRNLLAAAAGLNAIAEHWKTAALEVWNEPDIGFGNEFPGEFVTALTKAVSVRFGLSGNPTAVVGGVFAKPPLNCYEWYIANGLLDYVDAVSYHSYTRVEPLENDVFRLREIEKKSGSSRVGIPYWITESGMPWPRGGDRALPADGRYSASEIAAKAVEFRALGIQRYFAFVYKFYNEHRNNFGMMDANGAPMRSMAAYTHLVRVLSHKEYLGDLKLPGAVRSRVFGGSGEIVACVYVPLRPSKAPAALTLPPGMEVRRIEGADGRSLSFADGRIPVGEDGLVYLYFGKLPERFLDRDTRAMKLYRLARDYRPSPRCDKPVVIQPDYGLVGVEYSENGIRLAPAQTFRCQVWFNNLSDRVRVVEPFLELPDGITADGFPSGAFELAPESRRELNFTLRCSGDSGMIRCLPVRIGDRRGGATPLVIALGQQLSPEHFKSGRVIDFRAMGNPSDWRKNASGEITIRRDEAENAIEFLTSFPPGVADRWTYPEFLLPEPGFLKNAFAVSFEVKVVPADKIQQMLLMTVDSDEQEHGTATYIPVSRPTEKWEFRSVFLPAGVVPENVRQLRLGVNALTDKVSVEIRNVKIFYTR